MDRNDDIVQALCVVLYVMQKSVSRGDASASNGADIIGIVCDTSRRGGGAGGGMREVRLLKWVRGRF